MRQSLIGLSLALLLVGCGEKTSVDPAPAPGESSPSATPDASTDAVTSTVRVNLNTATREEFLQIPEVTERMAHEFDEYRPYASIRQFRREIGKYVDQEQVARYERYVFVPIVVNECDAETLQQIPGVDAAIAAAIIAGRPYATPNAALEALGAHIDAEAVEGARVYVAK